MAKGGAFSGKWQSGHEIINMKIPIIIFEEDGSQIVYCPALDVSGYGNDELEAKESFKISLGEFFTYTLNKNTFRSELVRMGWTLRKSKYKPMHPPSFTESLINNDNFSRIFNNFPFRKVDENIPIPV
jgi:hypothetical protein